MPVFGLLAPVRDHGPLSEEVAVAGLFLCPRVRVG
jgi:hypothetical protein